MDLVALVALSLAGSWLALPLGRDARIAFAGRLGQGFLAGALVAGFIAAQFERAGVTAYAWPLFAIVLLAAIGALVREVRSTRHATATVPPRGAVHWATLVLALVVAAHATLALAEIDDRPTYAWDAWTNWIFRARAWFLEPGATFTAVPVAGEATLQVPGAHYPATIPGLVAWLARLAGEWSPHRFLAAWPFAYVAAALAFAALADTLLRGTLVARIAAIVLAATPIVATHAMLAGYADLWMLGAVVLALGAATSIAVAARPDPRAFVLLLLALAVKIEGLVWLALLAAAYALARWPKRAAWVFAVCAAAALLMTFAWPGGVHLFDDRLVFDRALLRIPYLGETALVVNPVLGPIARAFFGTETFGLAMWAIAAALVAAWPLRRAMGREQGGPGVAQRTVTWFALASFAFVFVLFAFTIAGQWALNQTSLSRVALQVLPAWLLAAARVFAALERPD